MTSRTYDMTQIKRVAASVHGRTDIPRHQLMAAFPRIHAHHVSLLTALGFVRPAEPPRPRARLEAEVAELRARLAAQ